ncbi:MULTISPECIES: superinfection immunity protein [Xenorhabdus]|uniref:superinfection immunity protein n=1 Tax=Xenorhabdus TaxID=626 RepID=UPI00069B295D|nr:MULTISPECIES: superinfection immunity protein [Xenorhabdus]WFQ80513.1 superinfection immunity protein [Xenorhabdus sp. SF857]
MEGFIGLLLAIAALFVYFFPTYVASRKIHSKIYIIAFINLIVGWTVIGWLGCLAWAMNENKGVAPVMAKIDEDLTNCPYCDELIKKKAIFCKHCRKDL